MNEHNRIARSIDYLVETAPDATVAAAAGVAGMSPSRFSRSFRRGVGVSPKRFLQHLRVEALKQCLAGGADVLSAADASGVSGPGRAHDALVTIEAMTPGEFRQAARTMAIHYGFHPSPLGEVLLAVTGRGLCFLGFTAHVGRDQALAGLTRSWPGVRLVHDPAAGATAAASLARGIRPGDPAQPLHLRGTNLQVQVWRALLCIPEGAVTAYADLAAAIDRPRAVRAVASAIGANPVAWLIPCHRVIRASGALGGYRWQLPVKQALLERESMAPNAAAGDSRDGPVS